MDGTGAGIAEKRKIDPGASVARLMSLAELRHDSPGEEDLERLSALRGAHFCLAEQTWGKLDCGAHKSI